MSLSGIRSAARYIVRVSTQCLAFTLHVPVKRKDGAKFLRVVLLCQKTDRIKELI